MIVKRECRGEMLKLDLEMWKIELSRSWRCRRLSCVSMIEILRNGKPKARFIPIRIHTDVHRDKEPAMCCWTISLLSRRVQSIVGGSTDVR